MLEIKTLLLVSNDPHIHQRFREFVDHHSTKDSALSLFIASHKVTRDSLHSLQPSVLLVDNEFFFSNAEAHAFIDAVRSWQKTLTIISVLEQENDEEIMRLLNKGVQDYLITKQLHPEVIRRTLRHAMQRKRYEDKIAYLSRQDHLTGLMSGDLIPASLRQAIQSAKRDNSIVSLYYIDIDHFKEINDLHGHSVGNALLIEIAARLQGILDEECLLARLSADIFILIDIADDLDACAVRAEEIISTLKASITINNTALNVSASIGIATYPECGLDEVTLLKHAEMSLYEAKKEGRGGYHFFSQELNKQATWRIHITSALKEMINDESFSLHYQPKIALSSGEVTGVEALIRWNHPIYGMVRPDQFIPLAEEAGLIANVTAWVLETACRQQKQDIFQQLSMAINISARELNSDSIVGLCEYMLRTYAVSPELLTLEITETAMMADSKQALHYMHALKNLGIKLHIDDFGTGYSSIDYLRRYPVDALKIDRSFIMHMHQQRDDARVVKLMVDIGKELGLEVVAEGVELAEQADMLRGFECNIAQGYYYSKPLPAEEFIAWYQNYTRSRLRLIKN
jgi:diguanylate cyclase (GGDEF)-like protein